MPLNAEKQEKVAAYAGQEIFYGVRPEFVSLSDEPFPDGGCSGEMVRVENMGHEFFCVPEGRGLRTDRPNPVR